MTDRYDAYLQVRLTTHDKERIKARALEAGLKTSDYVRKRALGERVGPRTLKRSAVGLVPFVNREAEASVALDGETMCEDRSATHKKDEALMPSIERLGEKLQREQLERNIRGSVGMQAPRNEP